MERLELWEELQSVISDGDIPWIIGGDFNVILNEDEKLGGLTFDQQKALDFAMFINYCSLEEVKFTGSNYTWWNGRIEEECIFKKLDRILGNSAFLELSPSSKVQHLIRQGRIMPPFI